MKEAVSINPYDNIGRSKKIIHSLGEVPTGIWHLRRSMEQKKSIDFQEAETWLTAVKNELFSGSKKIFVGEREPKLKKRLAAGFSSVSYIFESNNRDWVMKVATDKPITTGHISPSSKEFAEWYTHNLELLRNTFSEKLPYLIPEPQEVLHISNGDKESTIVLQPFINVLSGQEKAQLNENERMILGNELDDFHKGVHLLRKYSRVIPDLLGGKGNFDIRRDECGTHLVLLDNGLLDFRIPAPLLRILHKANYRYRIARDRSRFQSL